MQRIYFLRKTRESVTVFFEGENDAVRITKNSGKIYRQ